MTHKGNTTNFILSILGFALIFFFFSINFISAEGETYATVKQHNSILLTQLCTNGTGTCAGCNISSILDSDQINALNNVPMIKDGSVYTYTFSNTSKLGFYTINTFCYDLSGGSKANSYKIEVTTTGKADDLSFWMSLLIVGLAIIMLILAFTFDSVYIAYISGLTFSLSGVLIYINGFASVQDLYSNTIAMVLLGFGFIVIFATAFNYNNEELMEAFGMAKKEKDPHDYFEEDGD
jgi:hypothetical protein